MKSHIFGLRGYDCGVIFRAKFSVLNIYETCSIVNDEIVNLIQNFRFLTKIPFRIDLFDHKEDLKMQT